MNDTRTDHKFRVFNGTAAAVSFAAIAFLPQFAQTRENLAAMWALGSADVIVRHAMTTNVTLTLVAVAVVSAVVAVASGYSLLKDDPSGTSASDGGVL
ncbi:hypothetical protein [Rhodococcus qingshengii]|uniref:hypothetical protein n=1 Tax=Rhodococcus qingshengii TaxID=334542 RepID=UPI00237CCE47|nr:hypothetical protein [Rhodococcus qingshengii]WCT06215.1 hypothetical protein PI247_31910 [Rhodococcus qingshengii]